MVIEPPPSSNSLEGGVAAIFGSVLLKLQTPGGSDFVFFEKAAEPVQIFGLMCLAFVLSEEFVIAEHLVEHSH
jgi:hypothetical protein